MKMNTLKYLVTWKKVKQATVYLMAIDTVLFRTGVYYHIKTLRKLETITLSARRTDLRSHQASYICIRVL